MKVIENRLNSHKDTIYENDMQVMISIMGVYNSTLLVWAMWSVDLFFSTFSKILDIRKSI